MLKLRFEIKTYKTPKYILGEIHICNDYPIINKITEINDDVIYFDGILSSLENHNEDKRDYESSELIECISTIDVYGGDIKLEIDDDFKYKLYRLQTDTYYSDAKFYKLTDKHITLDVLKESIESGLPFEECATKHNLYVEIER